MKYIKGFSRQINEQFTLHIAQMDKEEFEKILNLNVTIHGEEVREYLQKNFWQHPRKDNSLWLYVKDKTSEEIVSTISIMPLEWYIGGILAPICEMGFVGTLEDYRGKGLIGKLNELYEEIMEERGYIISVIRGIPYYYRKLGYEFVIPLDYRLLLAPSNIPNDDLDHLKIREVKQDELEIIKKLYNSVYSKFFIWNKFDLESFKFRFYNRDFNVYSARLYYIENNDAVEGYFTFGRSYDHLGYEIMSSELTRDHCIKILQYVKQVHGNENREDIDLAVKEITELAEYVRSIGGINYNTYAWQIKIPNLKRFFIHISSLFENRLNNSKFKELTQTIKISNYSETINVVFDKGRITEITSVKGYPPEGSCDLQVPGTFLFKILLADRTFNEVNYILKDSRVKKESKELIDILFPKEKSFPESYY